VDDQLQGLRADVEANVDVPDFDHVAARADRVRRRRTMVASAATALLVAIVAVGVTRSFDSARTIQPVHQPVPHVDRKAARVVLAHPGAYVDTDASRVDGHGDVLSEVRFGTVVGAHGACSGTTRSTALRWLGANGRTTAWLERPRPLLALPNGFVVGALPAGCRTGAASDGRAYLVDSSGVPRGITWAAGAERICGPQPRDPRCRYDVATRRGSLVTETHLPAGAVLLQSAAEGMMWARSGDARRIYWSRDGRSWRSRATSLPAEAMEDASAAGRCAALAGQTTLEYTSDAGHTWHSRDVSEALRSVRHSDIDWTVTRSGDLLGVTEVVGRGDVLFRSTDASWSHFVETHVHTGFGLARPAVEGGTVYVPDTNGFLISNDNGVSWQRTPPLP
jgi:hypothetical protein